MKWLTKQDRADLKHLKQARKLLKKKDILEKKRKTDREKTRLTDNPNSLSEFHKKFKEDISDVALCRSAIGSEHLNHLNSFLQSNFMKDIVVKHFKKELLSNLQYDNRFTISSKGIVERIFEELSFYTSASFLNRDKYHIEINIMSIIGDFVKEEKDGYLKDYNITIENGSFCSDRVTIKLRYKGEDN